MSEKPKDKQTTNKDVVIPILNGKVQEETSLDSFILDLGNKRPNNWSKI